MENLVDYGSSCSDEEEEEKEDTSQRRHLSSLAETLKFLSKQQKSGLKNTPAEEMRKLDIKEEKDAKVSIPVKRYGPTKPDRILSQTVEPSSYNSLNHAECIAMEKTKISQDEKGTCTLHPTQTEMNSENSNNLSEVDQQSSNQSSFSKHESSDSSSISSSEDEILVGPPVPLNITTGPVDSTEDDENFVGPPIPSKLNEKKKSNDSECEEDEDSEEDEEAKQLAAPLQKNITFKHGSKAVTALAIDPAGARLSSGAVDYEVKFWDFAGMDSSLHSFRSLYPCGNNPIKCIEYSCTGDAVLIISGMSQAKIFDRDGIEILECVKGDQYIADIARTKGHTSPLTAGIWHPYLRQEFMTTSEDSSCRLWDVSRGFQHKNIMKCKTKTGLKTTPTVCAYSRDGNLVACGCLDGSIQMWDHRKMFVNTTKLLRHAHRNGSEISSLQFSYHGNMLCTRACDDTLKLWDLRNFRSPVHAVSNLFSRYGSTSCTFSPNDALVVTGESVNKGETDGKLHLFKTTTFEKVRELIVPNSHIIKTIWHPRLNQIFIGCGDGAVKIFYDEEKSARGAKLFIGKKKTKKRQADVISSATQPIITPHSLPLFRQEKPKPLHKKLEKERLDPIKSHRPDLPIKSGQGGRVAASGSTLSSYVIRNLGLSKRVEDDQDPREAILRFAEDAAKNPYWIAPAYAKTQPHAIFKDEETEDANESESKKPRLV